MKSFDRLGIPSGAVRWRMPLALLLSVLVHLLALTGIESRFGVADRGPQPDTMTVELLPPPAPPVAVAPPPASPSPSSPARSSPREASPPPRAAAPRPRPSRRPPPAPVPAVPPPPAVSAATTEEVLPPASSESQPTDPFPTLGQSGTDPAADAASTAPDEVASRGVAGGAGADGGSGSVTGGGTGSGAGSGDATDRATSDPATSAPCVAAGDAATQAAPLPAPPAGGRWIYDVFFGEYTEMRTIARVEYQLQLDGDRYAMRSEGSARGLTALFYSGLITQSSTGRIGAGGVQPERYVEQRGKRAPRTVEVDRAHCEVVFGDSSRRPLVDGTQDRLSSLLQLGLLARAAPASFDAGRQIELPELTNSSVQIARYRSEGAQQLDTENGPLRALHLVRLKQGGEEPTIEIWLGYDHAMLPVRIRVTEYNGRVFDQLLSKAGG